MFVRRKKNISGIISVQVIDKSGGKYRVAKTIGSSADEAVLRTLVAEAELWMRQQSGLKEFDFAGSDLQLERLLGSIQQISIAGIELILGKLFQRLALLPSKMSCSKNWCWPGFAILPASSKPWTTCAATSSLTPMKQRFTATWTN